MLNQFINDKRGNFAIIFALTALPTIAAAGMAIDYARANNLHWAAQNAADASILAGVREAERLYTLGGNRRSAELAGRAHAIEHYHASMIENQKWMNGYFDVAIQSSGNNFSGRLNVNAKTYNSFGQLFNVDTFPIEIEAEANIAAPRYTEVHFVIDTSASMGVGATQSEIARLANATRSVGEPNGCAFACHVPDELTSDVDPALDTLDEARAANIQLRIDVVKQAVNEVLTDLEGTTTGNFLRVGLHTFSNHLDTVSNPNPSITNAKNKLARIDLSDDLGAGGTDFHRVFDELEQVVGTSGDGSSPSRPQKTVVFITDGISTNAEFAYGGVGGHSTSNASFTPFLPTIGMPTSFAQIQGFDERICDDLKRRNKVTLVTLNVAYTIPTTGIRPGDTRFRDIDRILKSDIKNHMEACATNTALSEIAEDSNEIRAALDELFANLRAQQLVLTN